MNSGKLNKNRMNVILTGLPRSGTTLTCHLLNKLADTVALFEPMKVASFSTLGGRELICDHIERFFESTRSSIATRRTCITKHVSGSVPDNHVSGSPDSDGLRKDMASKGEISIDKDLTSNFMLCIKHPSAFTAILESLHRRFPCYATIRNPLSVLASWNSVRMPFGDGHAPAAEALDKNLAAKLQYLEDKTDRQLFLLSWFFDKYDTVLPADAIIRYEDVISSSGKCLAQITPVAADLKEHLVNKNSSRFYDYKLMAKLGEKLLKTDGAFWKFYSMDSVRELMDEIL